MADTGTTFSRWLERGGETASGFADRTGMSKAAIYALAGIRSHRSPRFFKTETLRRLSLETGIPVTQLYTDWEEVEQRPTRKYIRKPKADAAAAE